MTRQPDNLDEAETSVGRRARPLLAPVRRLVNAPHLLVMAVLAIWVGCSLLYALIEDKGPVEGLWWGVVTGSTVGYGDYYPATTAGRAVAVVLIISMLVLVPIAIGHVIANLVLDRDQFSHDEQVALAATIESLHDRVHRLEHLLAADLEQRNGAAWVAEQVAAHQALEESTEDHDDRMLSLFRDDE